MATPEPDGSSAGSDRVLAEVLAHPPEVHPVDRSDPTRLGVWRTDEDCYRLLGGHIVAGSRTLETGCGLSTVVFAALGADHVCCTPGAEERDRLLDHCRARGIDTSHLEFRLGSSHETLPVLAREERVFDVFLVDGGHGFPLPVVDWFYGASLLRRDGLLVLDDVTLPAVRVLVRFLDRDPRWAPVQRTAKWVAYRRRSEGPLAEDWTAQPFHRSRRDIASGHGTRLYRRGRRLLRRITRSAAGA